jgi:glutathione peroxidase
MNNIILQRIQAFLMAAVLKPCAEIGKRGQLGLLKQKALKPSPVRAGTDFVMDKANESRVFAKKSTKIFATLLLGAAFASPVFATETCSPLLQHSFPVLQDGKQQSLCQWQGKVLLVVNTASYCGYTSQYDGLEKLYEQMKARGLVVVGFPSNDFGEQEPGANAEIAEFCRLTYGVQFPMFAKAKVVGRDMSPFYAQLAKETGKSPQWNFHKYLIDRSGRQVVSFDSSIAPNDKALLATIESFLKK